MRSSAPHTPARSLRSPKTTHPRFLALYKYTHFYLSLPPPTPPHMSPPSPLHPRCWRAVCVFLLCLLRHTHTARIVMVHLHHHKDPEEEKKTKNGVNISQRMLMESVVNSVFFKRKKTSNVGFIITSPVMMISY